MHTVLTSTIGKVDLYRQNINEKENKNQAIVFYPYHLVGGG